MDTRPQPPALLMTSEVAAMFAVESETVRRWVRQGRLTPACRTPGGSARFRRDEIEAALRPETGQR